MNKSLFIIVMAALLVAGITVIILLYKPKEVAENFLPLTAPHNAPYASYSDKDNMCGQCDKLNSDLSRDCGCARRSLIRYPIDLPGPEEPPAPGMNTCFNELKYNLQ